jgi:hypothetical protein
MSNSTGLNLLIPRHVYFIVTFAFSKENLIVLRMESKDSNVLLFGLTSAQVYPQYPTNAIAPYRSQRNLVGETYLKSSVLL